MKSWSKWFHGGGVAWPCNYVRPCTRGSGLGLLTVSHIAGSINSLVHHFIYSVEGRCVCVVTGAQRRDMTHTERRMEGTLLCNEAATHFMYSCILSDLWLTITLRHFMDCATVETPDYQNFIEK